MWFVILSIYNHICSTKSFYFTVLQKISKLNEHLLVLLYDAGGRSLGRTGSAEPTLTNLNQPLAVPPWQVVVGRLARTARQVRASRCSFSEDLSIAGFPVADILARLHSNKWQLFVCACSCSPGKTTPTTSSYASDHVTT